MVDSRNSGKAAERRVAKDTKGIRMGIMGHDDVRCPENYQGIGISWEVKIRKKLPTSITKWFKQAEKNVYKKNLPILAMKEKGTKWGDAFVMMKYEHFLRYLVYFYMEEKK